MRITPLRTGWSSSVDDESFYPPDLPEDWRLTYFANEFAAVCLPYRQWSDADSAQLAQWREETPARFRFYLDLELAAPDRRLAERVAAGLGDRLGGWIGPVPPDQIGRLAGHDLYYERSSWSRPVATTASERIAREPPPGLDEDPRLMRAWLEDFAAVARRPALLLLGEAAFASLRRWQTLLELRGLA